MICPNCSTVNPENARYCISCGQPMPRICSVCGAVNPPDARFCNQCGSPLDGAPLPTGERPAQLNGNHTSGVVLANATTPAEETTEQRRVVTILFADLASSTALAEDLDPEDARALLAVFFGIMAREIHRHGGTVEKYIGDAVMAVFGLPVAHEDDPVRAVRAALDMQTALRQFNDERHAADPAAVELQMRIGINTGEVAAAGAASEGRDFLVTGDAVNVAARLQQLATPGTILVGSRTWRATQGAVRYRDLPPAIVRNRARPVKIWEALAMTDQSAVPTPRPRGVAGLKAPMVGRDVEMELMHAVSSRVLHENSPHLVTIFGLPGIGKTRLAREFLRQPTEALATPVAATSGKRRTARRPRTHPRLTPVSDQPVILEGRCPPYGEGITYWPLADMLRAYCGIQALESPEAARARLVQCVTRVLSRAGRRDDPALIAAYIGYTIGLESKSRRNVQLPVDAQQKQEGLLRAWRVFFEALAQPTGLILLIEDIHWADDALLDLIEFIAARAMDVPLMLLCTARPELLDKRPEWGGGKRNYVTIGLEALSPDATQQLMRELLPGATVPQSLRQGIVQKAEGNPFYIEEIVRMFVDLGILVHSNAPDAGWQVAPEWEGQSEVYDPGIPDTVQGVLNARLDLLAAEELDVLQHAAVIGRYFWPSALVALAPHLERARLDVVLQSLIEKELLIFADHSKTSVAPPDEPIYSFNHALTREVVYGAIARTRRAHEHERVAAWLETLAQGREEEFAELLAQHYRQYYIQANLSRTRNAARRQAVLAKVVHYLIMAGDQAAARHASSKAEGYYTDTIRLIEEEGRLEDAPLRQALFTRRGDARWSALRADEAWADYRTALELWAGYEIPHDESGKNAGSASTNSEQAHRDWLTQGMRLYRLLVALPTRYSAYFQQMPTYDELKGYLDRGLKLADAAGCHDTAEYAALLTATSFFWMSAAEHRGERELMEALRSAREAVRITENLGDDPRGASEALDALGNLLAITTDLRGFLETMTRRLQWAQQIDDPNELVDIHTEVSQAHQVVGEYAEAVTHARAALDIARAAETEALQAHALRALTLAYYDWDHWAEALAAGEDLLRVSAQAQPRFSHRQLAAVLAMATMKSRMGDRDGSDRLARQVAENSQACDVQYLAVGRARLALSLGATREARQLLLNGLEDREGRVGMAMLLAELAELLAREGEMTMYDRYGPQALELGWRSGARKALAQAIRARGIVAMADGRLDDALADIESAFTRYADLGTVWEEARTRYALAGLYRRRGEPGDEQRAYDELTRAQAIFSSLSAVRDLARTRTALAGGDIRLP
jgi:class 3 adenylate cyclase/tetratricopeptide (TPR) repeat protein/ribosomal protein L40E